MIVISKQSLSSGDTVKLKYGSVVKSWMEKLKSSSVAALDRKRRILCNTRVVDYCEEKRSRMRAVCEGLSMKL